MVINMSQGNEVQVKKQYGVFTAISMIVGIVIGSGIFFKSDDILGYTSGNVMLGVFVFALAAISIIFGSLSIAQLAIRTSNAGGVITYAEDAWSPAIGGAFGWFHTLVYYPTINVVVSWVSGIYLFMFLGIESTLEMQCIVGFLIMSVLFVLNIIAKKLGDWFQISTTFIKLIPLFLIGAVGLFLGDGENITTQAIVEGREGMGFIAAIVPIAYSFDGWIMATSISHEMKDGKRKLSFALIMSPIFILIIYALYLVGISAIVGPDQVIALGDAHVDVAANVLFGPAGAKIVLMFVLISVIGTVNGITMGYMRLPYSLALRKMFPNADKVGTMHPTYDVPLQSSMIAMGITIIWFMVHYATMKYSLLQGSDVSEIAIVINYVCYIALYMGVVKLYRSGTIKNVVSGVVNPVIATIGSCIIFIGSATIITEDAVSLNGKSLMFIGVSLIVLLVSYCYCRKKLKM